MFDFLYPITGIAVLIVSALWYYYISKKQKSKPLTSAFWILAVVYLVALVGHYGLSFALLLALIRDIVIFVGFVYVFHLALCYRKLRVFLFLLMLVIAVGYYFITSGGLSMRSATTMSSTNGELLFDIKDKAQLDKIKEALSKYNPIIEQAFPHIKNTEGTELDDYYVLDIDNSFAGDLQAVILALNETNAVDWAEINETYQVDPLEGQDVTIELPSTGLKLTNDPLVEYLWAFVQMKMEDHYKNMKDANYKKKKTAKIFILDTGVDSNHEDISANFFSTDKKYDTDANGHGTHCAGIANAVSNNSLGIASYCPKNDYMQVTSIKVLGDNGGGTQESIIDGIILAADEGADVISMSLGGRAVDSRERAYNEAIAYATRAGAIVVVAAGNSNSDARQYVPACCDGVIAVSAVDPNLSRASFSNYVNNIAMKVAAPGVNIYSTFPSNQYKVLNGTSMATPYVAGLLGMMKSLNPKLTAKEAYSILEQTGIETGDTPATGKFIQPATSIRMVSKN